MLLLLGGVQLLPGCRPQLLEEHLVLNELHVVMFLTTPGHQMGESMSTPLCLTEHHHQQVASLLGASAMFTFPQGQLQAHLMLGLQGAGQTDQPQPQPPEPAMLLSDPSLTASTPKHHPLEMSEGSQRAMQSRHLGTPPQQCPASVQLDMTLYHKETPATDWHLLGPGGLM